MRRPNRRTGIAILLLMCMMLTLLPVDVLARDEYDTYNGADSDGITIEELITRNLKSSYPYTGQPVDLGPLDDKELGLLIFFYDSDKKPLDVRPYEPGSYYLDICIGDADPFVAYHRFTIVRETIIYDRIQFAANNYTGAYDGNPHSISLDVTTPGVSATYATTEGGPYGDTLPEFTEVGEYTVYYRLYKELHVTEWGSATVTITEPEVVEQEIEYTAGDYFGAYDGVAHSIALDVVTEGVAVTYATAEDGEYTAEKPSFTEPGEYAVWFRLEKEGYATVVASASVNIMERSIEYSSKGYTGYYDGKSHSISLSVSTPDATVTYATSQDGEYTAEKPSFTKVGTYTVWYRIEKEHYNTVEGSEVVKIQQLKDIDYSVNNYVGEYDGEGHTIALDITTSDVSVSYSTSKNGKYTAAKPS